MESQTKNLNLSDLYRSEIKSIIVNYVQSEDWEKVIEGIELIKTIDAKFKPSVAHNSSDTIPVFNKDAENAVSIKYSGDYCHDHVFKQRFIVEELSKFPNYTAHNREICKTYENMYGHLFTDYDKEILPKNDPNHKDVPRWANHLQTQFSKLKAQGVGLDTRAKWWALNPEHATK